MPDVANGRDFNWPAGARCAFSISWDVDVDSMLHLQHGDRAYEQYATLSYLRYDEVAVPNIVRACAQLEIHSTFFVPGWCVERYPAMCETIVAGGHEVAYHGYMHEAPNSQTPEGELAWQQRASRGNRSAHRSSPRRLQGRSRRRLRTHDGLPAQRRLPLRFIARQRS